MLRFQELEFKEIKDFVGFLKDVKADRCLFFYSPKEGKRQEVSVSFESAMKIEGGILLRLVSEESDFEAKISCVLEGISDPLYATGWDFVADFKHTDDHESVGQEMNYFDGYPSLSVTHQLLCPKKIGYKLWWIMEKKTEPKYESKSESTAESELKFEAELRSKIKPELILKKNG